MFDIAPEPFDEDIVECPSTPVHTDDDAFPFQHAGEDIVDKL
jgi:hypothetical protein